MSGLQPNTIYYVRAYATNSKGTSYGEQISFTTNKQIVLAAVTTTAVSAITETSAISGGNVTSDGGATVTNRGICWNTTGTPTITDSKTTDGNGTGIFTSNMSGLQPNTIYYVRAYATNGKGTSYGEQISFTTKELNVAIVDVHLETKWDYWVVGKDGDSFFVKINIDKPTIAYFIPDKNKPGYVIVFNDDGLPSKLLVDGCVFLFENYREQLVDIASISVNGDIIINRDVLRNEITQKNLFLKSTNINEGWILGLKLAGNTIGAASCLIGLAEISTGVGAGIGALTMIGCAATVTGWIVDMMPSDFELWGISSEFVGGLTGSIGCATGNIKECILTSASLGTSIGEDILKSQNDHIQNAIVQIHLPSIATNAASAISTASAICGGSISSNGGSPIMISGVCWNTSNNPSITNLKTTDGSNTSNINGLTPNTTYYARAYATNSFGTAYGNNVIFTTKAADPNSFNDSRDNKTYKTFSVNGQTWMAENLAYLPSVNRSSVALDDVPLYYVYGNYNDTDIATVIANNKNYSTYGVLYNWSAAVISCPTGWHLPSDAEWAAMVEAFGGNSVAGGKFKSSSNISGFFGGYFSGGFNMGGTEGWWWSSTRGYASSLAWRYVVGASNNGIYRDLSGKREGYSVRCVKD